MAELSALEYLLRRDRRGRHGHQHGRHGDGYLYVACERLLPLGHRLSRAVGVGLIAAGAIVLARAT
jgi:hypothetical protein